jgi:hypothetical protein
MTSHTAWRAALATTAAFAFVLPVATAAADEGPIPSEQATAAVSAVDRAVQSTPAADQAEPVAAGEGGGAEAPRPELPATAADPVVLGSEGSSLAISLPGSATAVASGESTTYALAGGPDVVAQALADGTLRLAVTIPGPSSPSTYRYPLALPAGVQARLDDTGGVEFFADNHTDEPSPVIGRVMAPWATDANGDRVPTSFSLDGDVLVQHVEFDSTTAFPVVADPSVIWKWKVIPVGLHFNRAETGRARNRGAIASMVAGLCWALGPETAGAGCGASAVVLGGIAAVASNAYGDHKCLNVYIPFIPHEGKC